MTQPEPARRWRVDERRVLYQPDGEPVGELLFFADSAGILATLNETESLRARLEAAEAMCDELTKWGRDEGGGSLDKVAELLYKWRQGRGETDGAGRAGTEAQP